MKTIKEIAAVCDIEPPAVRARMRKKGITPDKYELIDKKLRALYSDSDAKIIETMIREKPGRKPIKKDSGNAKK